MFVAPSGNRLYVSGPSLNELTLPTLTYVAETTEFTKYGATLRSVTAQFPGDIQDNTPVSSTMAPAGGTLYVNYVGEVFDYGLNLKLESKHMIGWPGLVISAAGTEYAAGTGTRSSTFGPIEAPLITAFSREGTVQWRDLFQWPNHPNATGNANTVALSRDGEVVYLGGLVSPSSRPSRLLLIAYRP